jgi:hypothetical protein
VTYTFIGDCHGKIVELLKVIGQHDKSDCVLQLGDMGLGFHGVNLPTMNRSFGFIRGNHDNPSQCQQHPNYAGEFGMWNGIFVVGGAYSIDWEWRVPGRSWWPDEELSDSQMEQAIQAYDKAKPIIVASHECPKSIGEQLLKDGGFRPEKWGSTESRTARLLENMFSVHKPKHWLFGHYHRDWSREILGTKFDCLNELSAKEIQI